MYRRTARLRRERNASVFSSFKHKNNVLVLVSLEYNMRNGRINIYIREDSIVLTTLGARSFGIFQNKNIFRNR